MPTQSLEPTAGRCAARLKDELRIMKKRRCSRQRSLILCLVRPMKRFSFMAFSAFAFLHIAGTT